MRDAYTLFDQVVAFSDGHITYEKIRDKLGLVGIDRLNQIFEACANGASEQVINLLDEFLQNGVSIEQLISNSADYLRSLLLIKSGITKEALLGNSVERYSKLVLEKWGAVQLERGLSIFLQLYRDIRYSLSPRYELELTFSRLCWLTAFVSNAEVKKAIDAAQKLLLGAGGVPAPAQTPVQTSIPVQQASSPAPQASETPVTKAPFDGLLSQTYDQFHSQSQEEGDQANPFPNGGPLPPQQSVGAAEYVVQPSETGYTENPDVEDDGWTNTDNPPEDDYYEEQLQSEQAEASYENAQQQEQQQLQPAQLDEHFTTADGRDLTIAQLRGSVIAELSVTEPMLASTLKNTGLWTVTEDKVETSVTTGLDFRVLQKSVPVLSEWVSKICGKKMQFFITQKNEEEGAEQKEQPVPVQVDVLVKAFKGTIVNG